MKFLDTILSYLDIALEVASSVPGATGLGAAVGDKFVKIAQAAIAGHEAFTGKPMDLTLLHKVDPVA